jgi:hypothetical protein
VTVASDVLDGNGMPLARMDYSHCENDRKNIAMAKRTLRDIFEAAGAQDILAIDRYAHLVGGCRMGSDAERSAVDSDHRAWEVPNLFIADGSVMPTQGSTNPVVALAARLVRRLDLKRLDTRAESAPQPRRRRGQPLVEDAARGADERMALDVLAVAGLLADHHHLGVLRALAEHGLGRAFIEVARAAAVDRVAQLRVGGAAGGYWSPPTREVHAGGGLLGEGGHVMDGLAER